MDADDAAKSRFLKGLLLTWVSFLVFISPIVVSIVADMLRSASRAKATGLGAVAGGISEALTTFGVAAMAISQVLAIVLLARTFDRAHVGRSFLSAISICCSVLLISFVAVSVWLMIRLAR